MDNRSEIWRGVDTIITAVELAKCWVIDRLCGPIPETDRAIRERGDRRFTDPGTSTDP